MGREGQGHIYSYLLKRYPESLLQKLNIYNRIPQPQGCNFRKTCQCLIWRNARPFSGNKIHSTLARIPALDGRDALVSSQRPLQIWTLNLGKNASTDELHARDATDRIGGSDILFCFWQLNG